MRGCAAVSFHFRNEQTKQRVIRSGGEESLLSDMAERSGSVINHCIS
jgi:hypothetical protein